MKYQLKVKEKFVYNKDIGAPPGQYVYLQIELFKPMKSLSAVKAAATRYLRHRNKSIRRKRDRFSLPLRWKKLPLRWMAHPSGPRYPGTIERVMLADSKRLQLDIYKIED